MGINWGVKGVSRGSIYNYSYSRVSMGVFGVSFTSRGWWEGEGMVICGTGRLYTKSDVVDHLWLWSTSGSPLPSLRPSSLLFT